jgi:protein O-mannosyl-transferase
MINPEQRWQSSTRSVVLLALCLLGTCLFVYQPAWHGQKIMDDYVHLPRPDDRSLQGLKNLWVSPRLTQQYHPLVDSVFWLEDRIWGDAMLGFHLTNIVLHVAVAGLLFLLLQRLHVPGAWFATAIFTLHPVQVESVAFLAEMKNILSALFLFAAILAYLRFDESRSRKWYSLAAALVLVGLFAKTITAYLPAFMLLLFWWKRGKLEWRRDVTPLLPFFLLGILAAIGTGWMEREFSSAKGEGFEFTPVDRILIAGRAFWFYLAKIFWPTDLMLIYPRWAIDPRAWWQYLYPAAAIVACAIVWMLRRTARALWVALLFFLFTLIPFLGFFNLRLFRFQFVADHFQYLPFLAVAVPVAAGVSILLAHLHGPTRVAVWCAILLLLGTLSALSWKHSAAFKDSETCYHDVLSKNPNAWPAHANLSVVLIKDGRGAEAESHLQKVLELNPRDSIGLSGIHVNIGHLLTQQGHLEEALGHFQKSLELYPDYQAYNSIGSIKHRQGKLNEALQNYEKALAIFPDLTVTQTNIAWILATAPDASLRNGTRALQLSLRAYELSGGKDPFFLHILAAAYAESGDFPNAIATAKRAINRANEGGLKPLAEQLRAEISLYELELPYRESAH